jgi:transketolase
VTYEEKLRALCEQDDRILVMTAENRAVIRNLPSVLGKRFIDVGIAEQTMLGMAAGLALRGRVPLVHALAAFLTMRAFEFARTDVGIPGLPVKLVGGFAGFLSEANGATHQAIEDISLMRSVPGMHVFCPSDEAQLLDALPAVISSPNPTYIRFFAGASSVRRRKPFVLGKAELLAEGRDVCVMTYGPLLKEAARAAELLEGRGLSVGLLNVSMPCPLDEQAVLDAARSSRALVVIEDHFQVGGLYSAVCECLVRSRQITHVLGVNLTDRWFRPALLADVLAYEGFTGERLAGRIFEGLGA